MKVSIIVPNYQGKEVFPDCIDSLLKQDFSDFEIIFVDDGSTDGSIELAQKKYRFEKKVVIVGKQKNEGYVAACNTGIRHAKGTYISLLNNDTVAPQDWVKTLYDAIGKEKRVVGSVVFEGDFRSRERMKKKMTTTDSLIGFGNIERPLTRQEKQTGLVRTTAVSMFMVEKAALKGYVFPPEYYMYGEDNELCLRLQLRGYEVYLNLNSVLYHRGSYTRKHVPEINAKAIIHGTKNFILNYLLFFETGTLIRISIPFMLLLTVLLFQPGKFCYRAQAYLWILRNHRRIIEMRKDRQNERKVSDSLFFSLLSYRVFEDKRAAGAINRILIRTCNTLLKSYYSLVGVKTYDMH